MKSKKKRPYLGFLKEYAFKKKLLPYYILTIAIIVLTAGVSLVRPELQGKVIDDLGNPHGTSLSAFMLLLAVFLGMLLLNYLMNYVQRYVVAVISEEIAADMRQKVEDKLSTVSVNFFEKIKLSDILLKVDKDVSAVKQCGITSIITLISNIVILVVVPPYMFSIHKGIAVSNIILLVSVPFISRILGKLIQETSSQVLEGYNSITSVLTNTYDNWFITRLFQCGQYVHDRYFEKNQKYKKETNRQNLLYILNTSTILRWTESTYVNRRISLMRGSTMRESVTDVRIILECLQEAYQMEGDMVRSGKNIHATMIYPFVRMLQEKCRDLTEEQIHKTLWKEYEISGADRMFVERASKILEPYEGEAEDEK